ncbi:MAG: DNA translocase FtsK, partial [Chloroflexi bacterium]|nr:DNA translocase FtsK [Chloroflexota bacterium]
RSAGSNPRSSAGARGGRPRGSRRSAAPGSARPAWLEAALRFLDGHRIEILSLALIALALFSFASLLVPEGVLARAWLGLLRTLFGWGLLAVPLALAAAGLWMLLRRFQTRLPHIRWAQVVGAALLYFGLLVVLHAALLPADRPMAIAMAEEGRGGGLLGAWMLSVLLGALGLAGTVVVLLAWLLAGAMLLAGWSVADVVEWVGGRMRRAGPGRSVRPAAFVPSPDLMPVRAAHAPGEAAAAAPAGTAAQSAEAAPQVEAVPEPPPPEWVLPDVAEILEPGVEGKADQDFDRERAKLIEETLLAFGAPAHVVEVNRGPTITQFGVEPDFVDVRGGKRVKVKVSKIAALADDLALALAAQSIRIEAPVPGKGYVGIEVPNPVISLVALRDVLEAESFRKLRPPLRLGLGRDVSGRPISTDLVMMPHLLIAGTTGSGKSVCVNALIASLLLHNSPELLKLVMVDPKRVELTFYNGIPHLLAPVVVDLERVVPALQWVSREMDERYRRFAREGVRNIAEFNTRMQTAGQKGLNYLVVVIDELADLMMLAPDETERVLTRLAQLARATGIHLVIATQRPSVDVITGLIKANFPARIAFAVASSVDSRVILDQPGAERLLGRGDMLFHSPDAPAPLRMQGAYVSEAELNRLILHWRSQAVGPSSPAPTAGPASERPSLGGAPLKQAPLWDEMEAEPEDGIDPLYDEAVKVVRGMRRASISLLQRRMRIGYTRSARLVDLLQERGIIGPAKDGSQAREVLDYGDLDGEPQSQE